MDAQQFGFGGHFRIFAVRRRGAAVTIIVDAIITHHWRLHHVDRRRRRHLQAHLQALLTKWFVFAQQFGVLILQLMQTTFHVLRRGGGGGGGGEDVPVEEVDGIDVVAVAVVVADEGRVVVDVERGEDLRWGTRRRLMMMLLLLLLLLLGEGEG